MGDEPTVPTLTALLAQRAQEAGDREFLRFGEWSWTFAEIDDWTSRLAHRLVQADGIRPGDRVAIMLPNVVHWPVVWLAALKAGAVVVPVNCGYQRADLAFVLRDSGARLSSPTPSAPASSPRCWPARTASWRPHRRRRRRRLRAVPGHTPE